MPASSWPLTERLISPAYYPLAIETAESLKQIILERPGERPFLVAMPSLATPDQTTAASLKFQERVTVGSAEEIIVGGDFKSVPKV
jgi:hypothetical protein